MYGGMTTSKCGGQQRAAPAADRNSVPKGRVILSASVSNVAMAPAPRAKQDETDTSVRATRRECGDEQHRKGARLEVLACFRHVHGRFPSVDQIDNITQRHPSADLHVSYSLIRHISIYTASVAFEQN